MGTEAKQTQQHYGSSRTFFLNEPARMPMVASPADLVWQKLVDSVTSRYPSLEMIDNASGYMRSVYAVRKFKNPRSEFQVRTRFICSISSKDPLVYKLKIESETADVRQDWSPYSRVFKEDAQLVEELQSRLGVK